MNFGVCNNGVDGIVAGVTAISTTPGSLCYEAKLPSGAVDSGRASLLVGRSILNDQSFFGQFIEVFTSDPTVDCGFAPHEPPPPVGPQTKDECKNGGFRAFPSFGFKNQGDCVAFVATRAKNEPGRNRP